MPGGQNGKSLNNFGNDGKLLANDAFGKRNTEGLIKNMY